LFERHQGGERAALVHINLHVDHDGGDLEEFLNLVNSAGVEHVAIITDMRGTPDPKYFVGSGKAEEIRRQVTDNDLDVIICSQDLSPSQERNLERLCRCRVMGRTGLILDVFAQRARSHEGKLQVELAQLRYLSTRLVRGWSHLERQKGGIGLRGPGETQLETDRRLLNARIKQIDKRLKKVRKQRSQSRRARKKAVVPTVSLVGYTNAGKSSVFNVLTGAGVYAADQLFATLDPTLRRCKVSDNQHVVLADTVGFIRQLPHDLIAAFEATLQEIREADLLLHVVDAYDEQRSTYVKQVNQVLAAIGAETVPQVLVYNKIDLLGREPRIERDLPDGIVRVWISAKTGAGIDLLVQALATTCLVEVVHAWLDLPPNAGRLRARLFAIGAVIQEKVDEYGICHLEVKVPRRYLEELTQQVGPAECMPIN
jgi:GTP-binding protein HflX